MNSSTEIKAKIEAGKAIVLSAKEICDHTDCRLSAAAATTSRIFGRILPGGLDYIDSWVSVGLESCYQLLRCDDESLFREWLDKWEDLVEFEIVPVITSNEASVKVLGDNHGAV